MTIAPNPTSNQVRWLQVWSLASVQGAISLTWIAYAIYLPKFIEQVFAYPPSQAQQFAALLLVIESAIAAIVEPLFGGLSDRWQSWYSSRMPIIVAATLAATAFFMGLPCIVIFGGANDVTRLILASLAILWAIAMATFRSPVICLLASFAGATQLPLAGSVLTLVGGFVASIRPLATSFILGLGAPATFTIASITLLAGVASLRAATIYIPKNPVPDAAPDQDSQFPIRDFLGNLAIVMLVGAAIGVGIRLLMGDVLPRTIKADITGFTGLSFELLMGAALIAQALLALGTGRISKFIDNKRLMIVSLGGLILALGLLSFGYGAIAAIILILWMLLCLSAVNNGMVAFALTMVPKSLSGLTVGTFFGGLSGAIAIFGYAVPKSAALSMADVLILTAIAFLIAGLGIGWGDRLTRSIPLKV
ncbi:MULTISPECIES: MFS transporter [Pseudanabaena]|uniref:Major facilitator superfamily MFS_1 n=2 Tax=Pseudanabaena TaxID=1152 RepID=L8MSI4_9CYAN|nr:MULTISPECIES: MFS transporter [Pseudanabaena]ELS30411.1 major facilitator superfamily MFS_1 [Pseudanabaena biceps PCC 7429]MDG3497309.1 MFS transporter [Pseudanabaena catenata USMAC16]